MFLSCGHGAKTDRRQIPGGWGGFALGCTWGLHWPLQLYFKWTSKNLRKANSFVICLSKPPFLFSVLCCWNGKCVRVCVCVCVCVSECVSVCCSDLVISIVLSSRSLIYSSALFGLLFIASRQAFTLSIEFNFDCFLFIVSSSFL